MLPRQEDRYFPFIPRRIMVVLNWAVSLTASFSSCIHTWGHTWLLARTTGRKSPFLLHHSLLIEPDLYSPVLHLLNVTSSSRYRRKTLINNSKSLEGREGAKTIKATDRHGESSGEADPHGCNWPEGSYCFGQQPLDRGSRLRAKGPVKGWKLSAAEHLVNCFSQALAGSVQREQTPHGKKQMSWKGIGFPCGLRGQSPAMQGAGQ